MRETAAYRAFVSHLNVSDAFAAFRQQRTDVTQQIRRFQLIMRCGSADLNQIAVFANVGKT